MYNGMISAQYSLNCRKKGTLVILCHEFCCSCILFPVFCILNCTLWVLCDFHGPPLPMALPPPHTSRPCRDEVNSLCPTNHPPPPPPWQSEFTSSRPSGEGRGLSLPPPTHTAYFIRCVASRTNKTMCFLIIIYLLKLLIIFLCM